MGILAQVYAPDRLEKTPLDVNKVTHLSGTAVLNGETVPINVTSTTVTDSEKSDDKVVVWKNSSCVVRDEDDVPSCVSNDDPDKRLISASVDEFATDRVTAIAVNDEKYLGSTGTPHEGLVNKFPFNTEKKTYPYWESTLGAPVDAVYSGTKTVDGIELYVFTVTTTDAPVDIADGVPGLYTDTKEMWVEPETGDILNQIEDQTRTTVDGEPVLTLNFEFTKDQQAESVDGARTNLRDLHMMTLWMPIVGFIGGALCVLAGLALLLTAGRRDSAGNEKNKKQLAGASS